MCSYNSSSALCRYTLLPIADLPRFLGCVVKDMAPMGGVITLQPWSQPYPLPLSKLASREELTHWLTRLLLLILATPKYMEKRLRWVFHPNNLVSFLNLLIHLHSVGFPAHWLSEFLTDILKNQLTSTAASYVGLLPPPLTEARWEVPRRKLFLDPWKVDWENILSDACEALPFPISIPPTANRDFDDIRICSPQEIGRYQVFLDPSNWLLDRSKQNRISTNQCATLMFVRLPSRFSGDELAQKIADIVEGKVTKAGDLYILTMVDEIYARGIVWRMRKSRFEKMRRENWVLIPVRYDSQEAGLLCFFLCLCVAYIH